MNAFCQWLNFEATPLSPQTCRQLLHTAPAAMPAQQQQQQQQHRARAPSARGRTLSLLQGDVVVPSTLSYQERTALRQQQAFQYSQLYNHSSMRGMTVYDRLTADAGTRQSLQLHNAGSAATPSAAQRALTAQAAEVAAYKAAGMMRPPAAQGGSCSSPAATRGRSGFVSNNNPALCSKAVAAGAAVSLDPPLSALHPITLKSYFKKYPLELLAAARPGTRTTNETLRMLGAYAGDQQLAGRLGIAIPHGSGVQDGGAGWA